MNGQCWNEPDCAACVEAQASLARLGVPEHLRDGLRRYAVHHADVGGFLTACLEDKFNAAVCLADEDSRAALREIAWWIYNEAPSPCHGSKEKVAAWLRAGPK